jgi:hypothetical protein
MPLWTSCLGRDCLVLELGQRGKPGGPASLAQHGPCRNGVSGECAGRRAWSVLGLERKADNAISNARDTIE